MISSAHKFIFIHIPKTGGNAIQTALEPHSDDQRLATSQHHGDGSERFEVRGPVTPTKHATLEDYHELLGDLSSAYRTMIVIRDPLERALSLYYSPSRLIRKGGWGVFNFENFEKLVHKMGSMLSFITVRGQPVAPDFVLRFDNLAQDFTEATRALGLPDLELPVINTSADLNDMRRELRKNPDIIALVRNRFAEDYAYFNLAH